MGKKVLTKKKWRWSGKKTVGKKERKKRGKRSRIGLVDAI
jgi:hypothetical protein